MFFLNILRKFKPLTSTNIKYWEPPTQIKPHIKGLLISVSFTQLFPYPTFNKKLHSMIKRKKKIQRGKERITDSEMAGIRTLE